MNRLCSLLFSLIVFLPAASQAHFTGEGHVHTRSETRQEFLNPDCRSTATCNLKRFTLTTAVNEVWFSDDPEHPTYANGVVMEYETDTVAALEKYAIVQFKKGCVFHSSNFHGQIRRTINDTVFSFGESVPYCFRNWVIDSQDTDPAYNSDPEYGRTYFARWNQPGSYDRRTQKFYGVEKPQVPIVYMTDYPTGAFVSTSGVKNTALEFKTCIYKATDVPPVARRDNVNFATPIHCFNWQNVYVYDFKTASFQTELTQAPRFDEPAVAASVVNYRMLIFLALFLILATITFLSLQNSSTERFNN